MDDKDKFTQAYENGRRAYTSFLEQAYKFMHEHPLRLDDTYDYVIHPLKNKNKA